MDASADSLTSAAKLVELLLVFGGVLAFGWWQLRDVARAREQTRLRRAAEQARRSGSGATDPASSPDDPSDPSGSR